MSGGDDLVKLDDLVKKYVTSGEMPDIKEKLKRIPKDSLDIKINWDRVTFESKEAKFPKLPDDIESFADCRILHTQDFVNNTCTEQVYTYKTSRRRLSACEKTYEEGYTIGKNVGVQIKVPGSVLEANAGLSKELSLMETERFQEEDDISWEVESQIRVSPKNRTIAELTISERHYSVHFEVDSTLKGRVMVDYKNLSNGQVFSSGSTQIAAIINYAIEKELLKKDQFVIEEDLVNTQFKGICKFSKGKTDIKLTERPLTANELQQE
ncbi:uncharacterized protein LOC135488176 [Lineus longissimus]|uniref:uncharacterized protein LOC135488176 n=1 Tax=Lineus longissimus TaxID=88925 RepID=UPI00315DD51B